MAPENTAKRCEVDTYRVHGQHDGCEQECDPNRLADQASRRRRQVFLTIYGVFE